MENEMQDGEERKRLEMETRGEAISEYLKNSANPYIRGEKKSSFDSDLGNFWRWACRDLKLFPDPEGRFVKLGGLFDLLFEENQSPKFLLHTFTVDYNGIEQLKRGGELDFRLRPSGGFQSERESAFSLHGCATGWYRIGGIFPSNSDIAKGIAIFNDKFYEKICSRNISDKELNEAQEILNEGVRKRRHYVDEKSEGMDYWGWLGINRDSPSVIEFIDMDSLEKRIKTINSIPIRTHLQEGDFGKVIHGLDGIALLREGDFYEHSNDVGLRAVEITKEKDLRSLLITPGDIKYLVTFDDSKHQIDYKILS